MYQEFAQALTNIDNKIKSLDHRQLQREFELIPLETFGKLQIDRPSQFPNLMEWLPVMPSAEVQQKWTGSSGYDLMKQSVNFIRTVVGTYHEIACKPLNQGKVLDFGCGWGRLIRLLYKYLPAENIYGVDPWDQSISLCNQTRLYGNFALSEYLPTALPYPSGLKFDLIVAFSVFTHLSEKTFNMCAAVLREYLSENGVIALTIRPREFWACVHNTTPFFSQMPIAQMLDEHDQKGFAFYPHEWELVKGEKTFGVTTVSLEYLKQAFHGLEVSCVEWSEIDPLQMIVFLRKQKKQ